MVVEHTTVSQENTTSGTHTGFELGLMSTRLVHYDVHSETLQVRGSSHGLLPMKLL